MYSNKKTLRNLFKFFIIIKKTTHFCKNAISFAISIILRYVEGSFCGRSRYLSVFFFQGTLSFRAHPPGTQALLGRRRRFFIIIIMRANEDILGRNLAQPFYPFCNTSAAGLSPGFSSARLCWFFFFRFPRNFLFFPLLS